MKPQCLTRFDPNLPKPNTQVRCKCTKMHELHMEHSSGPSATCDSVKPNQYLLAKCITNLIHFQTKFHSWNLKEERSMISSITSTINPFRVFVKPINSPVKHMTFVEQLKYHSRGIFWYMKRLNWWSETFLKWLLKYPFGDSKT